MDTGFYVGMGFLGFFGAYVVTSVILLRFPRLLHRRKIQKFKAVHISHRGGAGEHLENTLTAFHHACALGTQMLEIDCHITKDGQVVVSHDNNLLRLTGHDVLINETNYADLPKLQPALKCTFMPGHKTEGSEDRQFALLRDVFDNFPNTAINIDIKIDDDELITKVHDLICEYKREPLTVWGNRKRSVTRKCYEMNPSIPLLASLQHVLGWMVLFYTGLLPFVPIKEQFYEICMPNVLIDLAKSETNINAGDPLPAKYRIPIRILDWLLMSKVMIRHLEARGIQTYMWVLNRDEDFERAFRLGADGVMTDFPSKLTAFLETNPQYCNSNHNDNSI